MREVSVPRTKVILPVSGLRSPVIWRIYLDVDPRNWTPPGNFPLHGGKKYGGDANL